MSFETSQVDECLLQENNLVHNNTIKKWNTKKPYAPQFLIFSRNFKANNNSKQEHGQFEGVEYEQLEGQDTQNEAEIDLSTSKKTWNLWSKIYKKRSEQEQPKLSCNSKQRSESTRLNSSHEIPSRMPSSA
eukprot:TRINITY_DN14407_c0_g1_i1.p3 TRINITY_DN14407_c0_g1~~TRINITY_DN14407_c0_g1_i1.p3  ORF type:complete len:131 (+),score=17.93 TRINITY_DN14407_c0_g1_i1:113-505(+)